MIFKDEVVVWKAREGVNFPFAKADENTISANAQVVTPKETVVTAPIQENVQASVGETNNVIPTNVPTNSVPPMQSEPTTQSVAPTASETVLQKAHSENINNPAVEPAVAPQSEDVAQVSNTAIDSKAPIADELGDKVEPSALQTPPLHLDSVFFNPNTQNPIVEGQTVHRGTEPLATNIAKAAWLNKPYVLRKKRADIFVNMNAKIDYLSSLLDFLKGKGFDIKPYDDSVYYLPSDILFLDSTDLVAQGTVYYLNNGKKFIWNALNEEFGDRLK